MTSHFDTAVGGANSPSAEEGPQRAQEETVAAKQHDRAAEILNRSGRRTSNARTIPAEFLRFVGVLWFFVLVIDYRVLASEFWKGAVAMVLWPRFLIVTFSPLLK
jgi:hypothetical protein